MPRTSGRRAFTSLSIALTLTVAGATLIIGTASADTGPSGPAMPLGTDATSNGTLGPSTFLGPETRAQIIDRAQDWVNQSVMYSSAQNTSADWNYWSDSATGGPYRQDCSGFVSMAWGLGASPATFEINASTYSTVTDANISGDTNLNPGDALDIPGAPGVEPAHIVLFDQWADNSGDFYYYAEHTVGQATNRTEANIYGTDVEGFPISDFEALQRNNLTAGSTPPSTAPDGSHQASQVVAQNDGVVDLLYQGADGSLDHDWYIPGSTWAGPTSIAGTAPMGSEPSTVTTVAGTVDTFWQGTDGDLWHDYTNGGAWNSPVNLGYGALGSAPRAIGQANGDIYVFWRGSADDHLWLAHYTAGLGWSGPSNLGGDIAAGTLPAPVSSIAGTTDVFFKGTDGNLWHVFTSNYGKTWTTAASLGYGTLGSSPTATGHADGSIDVTWRGSADDHLWLAHYTAGVSWSSQAQNLGGDIASGTLPTPVTSADNTTDIFFKGTDGNLWHVFSNDYGQQWSTPASLGMSTISQPLAAGQTNGTIDVFWKGTADTHIWHAAYTPTTGWTTTPTNMGGNAQ